MPVTFSSAIKRSDLIDFLRGITVLMAGGPALDNL